MRLTNKQLNLYGQGFYCFFPTHEILAHVARRLVCTVRMYTAAEMLFPRRSPHAFAPSDLDSKSASAIMLFLEDACNYNFLADLQQSHLVAFSHTSPFVRRPHTNKGRLLARVRLADMGGTIREDLQEEERESSMRW